MMDHLNYSGTLLIVSPSVRTQLTFTGFLAPQGPGEPVRIDRLWRVGESWQLTRWLNSALPKFKAIFDRSVSAFGPAIQGTTWGPAHRRCRMRRSKGSAVAEQLVRLGVRHLILIDADTLTQSNVTRVYGSTPAKVGAPTKVQILHEHLTSIAPDLECIAVRSMITVSVPHASLSVVISRLYLATAKTTPSKLVLSRFSTYFATPVIDLGVLLTANSSSGLTGIDGRVTTLLPGAGCLVCRDRVDMGRAAVELRTPEEERRLADEGYAPDLNRHRTGGRDIHDRCSLRGYQ